MGFISDYPWILDIDPDKNMLVAATVVDVMAIVIGGRDGVVTNNIFL